MSKTLPVLALTCLTGCAVTEPVVVIGKDGQTLKGTATGALSGGRFNGRSAYLLQSS
jgi:hypothetical protein